MSPPDPKSAAVARAQFSDLAPTPPAQAARK